MKKIIALVVLLCALTISSTAKAAKWENIGGGLESIWEIDKSSVSYDKNNYEEIIFHAFFKEINNITPPYDNILNPYKHSNRPAYSIYSIFFKESGNLKYVSIASSAHYEFDGSVISSNSHPTNFAPIPPDSLGEMLFYAAYNRL